MAKGQGKGKNTAYFNIAILTNGLETSVKRVMSLFNKMVKGVNSSLSKLGKINDKAFTIQSPTTKYNQYGKEQKVSATNNRDTRSVKQFYKEERARTASLLAIQRANRNSYNEELESLKGKRFKGVAARRKKIKQNIKETNDNIKNIRQAYQQEERKFLLQQPYSMATVYNTGAKKGTKQTRSESWGTGEFAGPNKDIELMAGRDIILETYHDAKKNIDVVKEKTIEWQDIETSIGIQRKKTNEYIIDNLKEQEKLQKRKEPFGKVLKRFVSVATYRTIRNILRTLAQGISNTIDGITTLDSDFKDTMSNVKSSMDMMLSSGGVALYNILKIIEPIIRTTAQIIAKLANAFSALGAAINGSSTYLRINLDYMKEYQSSTSGALLAFDTFTTMSSGNGADYRKMMEEVSTDAGGFKKELEGIEAIINTIISLLTTKLIGSVLPKIITLFTDLKTKTQDFGAGLDATTVKAQKLNNVISGIQLIFFGITQAITSIFEIARWDEQTTGLKKFFDVLTLVATGLSIIAGVLAAFLPAGGAKIAKAIGYATMLGAAVGGIGSAYAGMSNYEAGGSYARGDVFRANEFGKTELVASSSSGGAVMNMQQLESAVHNGVASAMSSSGGGDAVIMLDGNKVGTYIAGNAGFRATANKRNTGLNWR